MRFSLWGFYVDDNLKFFLLVRWQRNDSSTIEAMTRICCLYPRLFCIEQAPISHTNLAISRVRKRLLLVQNQWVSMKIESWNSACNSKTLNGGIWDSWPVCMCVNSQKGWGTWRFLDQNFISLSSAQVNRRGKLCVWTTKITYRF